MINELQKSLVDVYCVLVLVLGSRKREIKKTVVFCLLW